MNPLDVEQLERELRKIRRSIFILMPLGFVGLACTILTGYFAKHFTLFSQLQATFAGWNLFQIIDIWQRHRRAKREDEAFVKDMRFRLGELKRRRPWES